MEDINSLHSLSWFSPVAKKPAIGRKVFFITKDREAISGNALLGTFQAFDIFKTDSGVEYRCEQVEMWAGYN